MLALLHLSDAHDNNDCRLAYRFRYGLDLAANPDIYAEEFDELMKLIEIELAQGHIRRVDCGNLWCGEMVVTDGNLKVQNVCCAAAIATLLIAVL